MTAPHRAFASPHSGYADLDNAEPRAVLKWAAGSIDKLSVATSFQSSGLVILHMLRTIRPRLPVLFLDTGFHFEETIDFKHRIVEMWDLDLVELRGDHGSADEQARRYGGELYRRDPEKCCFINKVEPLQRALESFDGWVSGLRRDQSPLRARTPIVEAQLLPSGDEILKIHPLAAWNAAEVDGYLEEHDIPTHPLLERGFASIGCRPCTKPNGSHPDARAGRWEGFDKTECGIHSFGKPSISRQIEAEQ